MIHNYSRLLRIGFLVSLLLLSFLPVAVGTTLWNPQLEEAVKCSRTNISQQVNSNSEGVTGWSASSFSGGQGIVVDHTGNIYTLTSNFHLVKWNASGNMLWDETWEANISGISEYGKDLCIDSDENIYAVGTITGASFFDKGKAIILVKWNTTGFKLWNRSWCMNLDTEEEENQFYDFNVASDTNGDVYTLAFATSGYVLVKWSASGKQLWNRTWTAPNGALNAVPLKPGLAISISENICTITGRMLTKWDTTGGKVWNYTFEEDPGPLDGNGVVFDDIENIYIFGHGYRAPPIMDAIPGVLLMGCDANGTLLWRKIWYGKGHTWGEEMVLDDEGYIYVVGSTWMSQGNWDILLMKWDTLGTFYGIKTWNVTKRDQGHNLALGKDKNIYCVGDVDDVLAVVVFSPDNFSIPERTVGISGFELPLIILVVCMLGFLTRRKIPKSKF
ncbi:MAG: hypothetical protein ACFFC7_09630 [Candidatus Hermodarchaeota archaeon]